MSAEPPVAAPAAAPDEGRWAELQGATRAALDAAVRAGRLPRALLLSGPAGVGKAALARWLARRLWCRAAEPPCGVCPPCRKVATGNHPDLEWLDRARAAAEEGRSEGQEITVGAVRNLGETLARSPVETDGRLAVLHGAEDLNEEAQNALLKLLEEPPGRSRLVLVAHQTESLLDTVRSRCQELRVPPLRPQEMAALFTDLDALRLELAGGRPGQVPALRAAPVEALVALVDETLAGGRGAAACAQALGAQLEALAESAPELDEASARRLLLDVLLARVVDLTAWTAGARPAPRLGPAPDRLPPEAALRGAAGAVHTALADLHRNLPPAVALLALGQEFVAAAVGADAPRTP